MTDFSGNPPSQDPPEPTRPAVWPFKNYLGKAAHEVPYSEPPLPTFSPSDEDEALL